MSLSLLLHTLIIYVFKLLHVIIFETWVDFIFYHYSIQTPHNLKSEWWSNKGVIYHSTSDAAMVIDTVGESTHIWWVWAAREY